MNAGRRIDRREPVIDHEQLQQHRRAAHHFDVDGQNETRDRIAVDTADGDRHSEHDRQRHRQTRQHQRHDRRAEQRRQIAHRGARRTPAGSPGCRTPGWPGSATRANKPRLVVVPDIPLAKDRFERAVAHGLAQDRIHLIAQRDVLGRGDDDVVAGRERIGMRDQAGVAPHRAIGEHVVEHAPRRRGRAANPNTDARHRHTTRR